MVSFSKFNLPKLQIVANRFNLLQATDSTPAAGARRNRFQTVAICCRTEKDRADGITFSGPGLSCYLR